MKKISFLFLLMMGLLTGAVGQMQHIKIVSFVVKNQLPAVIDNWNSLPGSLLLVAQKGPNARVEGVRLVLQIKGGGAIICGANVSSGLPVENNFTTRTFSVNELTGLLASCHELKEGSYMLCAQFFNIDRVPISEEVCKPFTVEAPKEIDYSPPTLITPENGKEFSAADMQKPLLFRWTPLVPRPRDPVTYRLKVWQLMQGQNGTQAMRSNQPIVVKDVDNITQAVVNNNIYTGPCRPPYLCDFIWQVQALNKEGKPMGRNNGNSDPYSFKITGEKSSCPENQLPEDNKHLSQAEASKPVLFRWTNAATPGTTARYRLKIWQLKEGQNAAEAMRSNQPVITRDADNVTEVTVSGFYTGPCRPPYLCDFVWAVEMLDATGRASCTSRVGHIVVDPSDPAGNLSCPVNIFPENNKAFRPDQVKQSIQFRWKPAEPKPQGPVTYRLKVWQLMQGQTSSQAMNNKPVTEKEVTDVTEVAVAGIYTGPCRPPYLCDFVWQVEMLGRDAAGQPAKVICSSSPTTFMVSQYIIQIDSIKVSCTDKPGVYSFSYSLTNPNPGTAKLTNFVVTSSTPAGASLAGFTPPLNTNIPANGQLTITGTINGSPSLTNICIGAEITDQVNTFWKASKDTCTSITPCKCTACDTVKITISQKEIKFDANGNISLVNNISAGPKTVKAVKAELVYYEYKPESDDCMLCNKDSKTYGNFDNGSLDNNNGNGGGTHSLDWIFTSPKNLSGGTPASFVITVPPTVKCCNANIRFCIRYVFTFSDCTVCNKLVCTEIKKDGCAKGNINPNTDQK